MATPATLLAMTLTTLRATRATRPVTTTTRPETRVTPPATTAMTRFGRRRRSWRSGNAPGRSDGDGVQRSGNAPATTTLMRQLQ
jgi:hypothetical protein